MDKKQIDKLVKLRNHAIKFYGSLEEKQSSTSLMNTRRAAYFCEQMINSLDDLLKGHVTFQ
jgi:hypothetical protein